MKNQTNELNLRIRVGRIFQTYGLALMTIVMVAVFAILNDNFLTVSNFLNVLEQNAALAIVAVGVTFAIIAANIDLSPGSVIALTGVMIALIFTWTGSIVMGILGGIGVAVLIGVFNGVLIAKLNINSVIVTLAAYIWARGLALALTEKDSIVIHSDFISFMNHRFFGLISPHIVLILFAYILGAFVLYKTKLGRYTYAIGGDETSTKQAGVNSDRVIIGIFAFSGFLVGIASIVTVSRLGAAQPNAVFGLELDAIAAVIIGGTSLTGGEGGLKQTVFGVLFLALLNNGLSTLGLRDATVQFYKGLIILSALFFEVTSRQMLKNQLENLENQELETA